MTNNRLAPTLLYYCARISQRLLLCTLVAATIIYWIIEISTAVAVRVAHYAGGSGHADSAGLNHEFNQALNFSGSLVLRWFIVVVAVTLILLCIKRFRKYDKPLLIDSIVIAGFCLVSAALAQTLVNAFVRAMA